MSIKVKHENIEELKKWGLGLEHEIERCNFCKERTRFWHKSNIPVCENCAKVKSESDLRKL